MRRIAALLCLAWSTAVAAQTGLEFEPQDIAYVEVRGTVHEALTGASIPNASVLAVWEGTTYDNHSSFRHCLRIDATRTRADGSFSLVTPAKNVYRRGLARQHVNLRIYRTGMQERFEPGTVDRKVKVAADSRSRLAKLIGPAEIGLEVDVRMAPSKEDVPDRLRTLQALANQPIECETRGSTAQVQSYFLAAATEAHSLAKTRYQRAVADALESDARLFFSDRQQGRSASSTIMQQVYDAPELSDLERRDPEGMTPLMRAAASGHADTVHTLLAAGANPNRTRRVNALAGEDSALTIAISRYANASISHPASALDYRRVIQALLADPRVDRNLRDRPIDYSPLMTAVSRQLDDVVEWLLAAGADPNLTAYSGQHCALGLALQKMQTTQDGKPDPAAVRQLKVLLASKRVDLDLHIGDGRTALSYSLMYGDVDMAKRLLKAGVNPNAVDRGKRTPLIVATEAAILNPKRPKFVESLRLIAAWPGVDHSSLYDGRTAMQMARDANRADLMAVL